MKYLFLLFFPLFSFSQVNQEIFTMFYNVENLFDTINNPNTEDEEFLPKGKKMWNTQKYNTKLEKLSRVFSEINNSILPNIIGLAEIENHEVIKDLLNEAFFKGHDYTIIHKESPDKRGIDCALLFDENFSLLESEWLTIKIPGATRPTRDIVYTKLKMRDNIIHVFVNHWPSRYGGKEKSKHKRVFTAKTLENYIKKNISNDDYIIMMGDFNDTPYDESVQDILVNNSFVNLMDSNYFQSVSYKNFSETPGSYNYKGEWSFIDHIIVSKNLNEEITQCDVFIKDWLLTTYEKGEKYPHRSYKWGKWDAGPSDHLPIYCRFKLK